MVLHRVLTICNFNRKARSFYGSIDRCLIGLMIKDFPLLFVAVSACQRNDPLTRQLSYSVEVYWARCNIIIDN